MFSFNSEEESKAKTELTAGPANIEIIKVYDTNQDGRPLLSKNGNRMVRLLLKARDDMGGEGLINEYVPLIPRMKWKAQQIVECFGMPEAFAKGELNTEALMKKKGRVLLKLDESPGYSPKIAVEQYIAAVMIHSDTNSNVMPADTSSDFDDEIPF